MKIRKLTADLKLVTKIFIAQIILILVVFFGSFAIGALVLKFSDKAEEIRQGVGREVILTYPGGAVNIRGTLTKVGYQYEPGKLGIIHFSISIHSEEGDINGSYYSRNLSTILSPFRLHLIKFVESQE